LNWPWKEGERKGSQRPVHLGGVILPKQLKSGYERGGKRGEDFSTLSQLRPEEEREESIYEGKLLSAKKERGE